MSGSIPISTRLFASWRCQRWRRHWPNHTGRFRYGPLPVAYNLLHMAVSLLFAHRRSFHYSYSNRCILPRILDTYICTSSCVIQYSARSITDYRRASARRRSRYLANNSVLHGWMALWQVCLVIVHVYTQWTCSIRYMGTHTHTNV